jgi:hypothetical protein
VAHNEVSSYLPCRDISKGEQLRCLISIRFQKSWHPTGKSWKFIETFLKMFISIPPKF